MKHIVIVDRRLGCGGTRPDRLKECIEGLGVKVTCIPEVYGGPSRAAMADFDEELSQLTIEAIGDKNLILLHCGDNQQLVPRVLWPDMAGNLPFLLYTGLPSIPDGVCRFLASAAASPKHVVLPMRLPTTLDTDWPQSSEALRVRRCVELILSGTEPPDALRIAFGDPRIDKILDALYGTLAAVPAGAAPEDLRTGLDEITHDRDTQLDAVYRERRGW